MNIIIVGGGTAGWITSLFLLSEYKDVNISVIESDTIGILGAGEGSTPLMRKFLKKCNIDENDFIKKTKSTFKLGIDFENWNIHNTSYKHPFINNAKAYHFDARLIAEYFKEISINRGVTHINGIVKSFVQNDKKDITNLVLSDDTTIPTDFVFDCSGLHRLLIGKLYNSNWVSYSNHLKVNTAVPFFLNRDDTNMELDTKAIAMDYGWMWMIPLQHRWGCGYVFDGNMIDEKQAKVEVEIKLNRKIESPKTLKFSAGYYDNVWVNNCIAIINYRFYKLQQCETSTGTAVYIKFKASTGTSKIKAKADNNKIPGLFCRHNYLSTNYIHFRQFVQTSNLVEAKFFVLLFLRRSSSFCRDLLSQPNSNSSHTSATTLYS